MKLIVSNNWNSVIILSNFLIAKVVHKTNYFAGHVSDEPRAY